MAGIREIYGLLMRRAITGAILGTIAGAIQMGFFKQGVMHLFAAVAAGVVYMAAWVLLTDWLKPAGGKVLHGAVAGLVAAVLWWAIAIHTEDAFIQSVIAGACFGATYAWSDRRMT